LPKFKGLSCLGVRETNQIVIEISLDTTICALRGKSSKKINHNAPSIQKVGLFAEEAKRQGFEIPR